MKKPLLSFCGATIIALLFIPSVGMGQASIAQNTHTPPMIRHKQVEEGIDYILKIAPGVATPGATTTIQISLSQVLEKHDATFGNRSPILDASLTAVLVGPKTKKYRKGYVEARVAQALSDAGSYGFSINSPLEAVHALYIKGTSETAGKISFTVPVSFGVWPIPEDIKLPSLPRAVPKATKGNIAHGEALCQTHCQQNLAFGYPSEGPLNFINSTFGSARSDATLLAAVVGKSVGALSPIQKIDLSLYLRSLHMGIEHFFPKATHIMVAPLTINEYGLERLQETANLELSENEAQGTVFVVYKTNGQDDLTYIDFEDRVARDDLKRSDKIGYIVFRSSPNDPRLYETGIALGLEPTYPIIKVQTRSRTGADNSLNKILRSFKGQGRFNDARSLRRGNKSLRKSLLPLYLEAAELATMYYADEREFSAFDSELDDID